MRKYFIFPCVLLLAALLLAACAPATATPQPTITIASLISGTSSITARPAEATAQPEACLTSRAAEGCNSPAAPGTPVEVPVRLIPLTEPAAKAKSEFSGLAWYSDTLILLPQYPERFEGGPQGALLALTRAEIEAWLDGTSTAPLDPRPIPLYAEGVKESAVVFEGFESVAFDGESIYLTIETRGLGGMLGYIIRGQIAPDLSRITLDAGSLTKIKPQAGLGNLTDEALLVTPDGLLSFYEANGANVNPNPVAHRFDANLNPLESLPAPTLEYRLTDASEMDAEGRFWVINYMYPGDADKLKPAPDALAARYGQGATHAASQAVERLVQYQLTPQGVALADRAPIQLELLPDDEARNWEGLVTLPGRGFLLLTDSFPTTLLGFVKLAD